MTHRLRALLCGCAVTLLCICGAAANGDEDSAWPPLKRAHRPWAYNWWLGSAVDTNNLARELRRYYEGELGGIHIIPIYGAKGAEDRYVEYLSPAWMRMLQFTIQEGRRLGLDVDLTTGTGWCFGGPNVPREQGGWRMQTKIIEVPADGKITDRFPSATVQGMVAVGPDGKRIDLQPKLNPKGELEWKPSQPGWKIFALTAVPGGPAVKRAAPRGAGPMINPFDPAAMTNYLARFSAAFAKSEGPLPRAMYHDSFEYGSSWSPGLLRAFEQRRGYSLLDELAAFCGDSAAGDDRAARVRADFKETLSDLLVEEVLPEWMKWSRSLGCITRNQAHGSPGNLLDLYALADIPETEMFGRGTRDPLRSGFDGRFGEGDRNPLISKFASSAAHVAGRRLVAAETGTWMAEHFCETLEELKCLVDLLFVSGVNHAIYHGCVYSPDDAAWPGWLFYASTQMNPRNSIWRDAPALNMYIARCQSLLQKGEPDNDVLLYWPIHELWRTTPGVMVNCSVHNHSWLTGQEVGKVAQRLWDRGWGFDYVSDRMLATAKVDAESRISTPGAVYRVVVVPPSRVMPDATLLRMVQLAEQGATVLFSDHLPSDVPGLQGLEQRRATLRESLGKLAFTPVGENLRQARVGRGRVLLGDIEAGLMAAGVNREELVDHPGARFIRRREEGGSIYFVANQGTNQMTGWHALATRAKPVLRLDPMTGRSGLASAKIESNGQTFVNFSLAPGHSVLLRTRENASWLAAPWPAFTPEAGALDLHGPWEVTFTTGGPALPRPYTVEVLSSWTKHSDPEAERFAGTARYNTSFNAPDGSGPWLLDLGKVCHSARVRVNGVDQGTCFMAPYRVLVPELKPTGNRLEVEVTNLSANRIRDLDRRKVPWRVFHDINLVNVNYRAFDASNWPVMDSGLIGPVKLYGAKKN